MQHVLVCPSCSAPLRYAGGNGPTIICAFCGNSVVVPDEWRPAHPPAVHSPGPVPMWSAKGKTAGILIAVAVMGIALTMVLLVWAMRQKSMPSDFPRRPIATGPVDPKAVDPKPPHPGFATVVLKLGGEGIGPGLFKDARSVAVDEAGNIYVGEYLESRVQVFDATGKFVTQWNVGPQMAIRAMAADRKGNVYIEGSGTIWRFEGSSGKEMGHIDYPGGSWFNDIAVTAEGGSSPATSPSGTI
jgi:hypothetical protein